MLPSLIISLDVNIGISSHLLEIAYIYCLFISWPLWPTNKNTLIGETGSICLLNHKQILKYILKITCLYKVGLDLSTGDKWYGHFYCFNIIKENIKAFKYPCQTWPISCTLYVHPRLGIAKKNYKKSYPPLNWQFYNRYVLIRLGNSSV